MKLKELRKELGLTQSDIAKKLSKTITCICDWERGRTEPNIEDLKKLSLIFNCSVDFIIDNADDFGNVTSGESALTENEKRLLKAFNSLSDVAQRKLIEDAEFYASNTSNLNSKKIVTSYNIIDK